MAKNKHRPKEVGIEIPMMSGFTILVKPLPPYYKDVVDDIYPLPEYPRRKVTLAAGDVIDWEYKIPDVQPSEDDEDYALYMKWLYIDEQRKIIEEKRRRARQDFLISNCVKVINGPYRVWDSEWAQRVEAAFPDYTVPTHPGRRMLVFLKTQVILSHDELEMIVKLCTSPEVTMQGIIDALRGFQGETGQRGFAEDNRELSE